LFSSQPYSEPADVRVDWDADAPWVAA